MQESYRQMIWRRFRHHRAGFVSLIILIVLVALAFLAPVIAPYDPNAIDPAAFSAAPSAAHLLGTDAIGRDVLSRLLYATRVSLIVGLLSTSLATLIGVVLGLLAGYFGGLVDEVLMRFTDMIMSFPYILLILVAGVIFQPGMWTIILILGFVDWPGVARLVRGSVLNLKEQDFVKSAQVQGFSRGYILFKEILPNCVAPILIFASGVMAISILDEASLSFLGMGIQPPQASLGNMLNGAQSITVLRSMPWLWLPPGLVIILLVICTNFVGDALRDAVDPSSID
jgi:peptide/nickel transport system permease protein